VCDEVNKLTVLDMR